MDSTQQQLQVVGTSWLSRGVASPRQSPSLARNLCSLPDHRQVDSCLCVRVDPLNGQQHTRALVRFFLFVMAFEWVWFFIAWARIRRFGKVTFAQLVGGNWNRASSFFLDLGIALGVLVVSLALGTLLQEFLGRFESSSAPPSSMVPQNDSKPLPFLPQLSPRVLSRSSFFAATCKINATDTFSSSPPLTPLPIGRIWPPAAHCGA